MLKTRQFHILIFLLILSLGLNIAIFSIINPTPNRFIANDSSSYRNAALSLLQHGTFSVSPQSPDTPQVVRTPGYPVFQVIIYALFGDAMTTVILIQCLLHTAVALLIYGIGSRLWGLTPALLAASLFLLDITARAHTFLLLTEILFLFWITAACLVGVRFFQERSVRWISLLGLFLALATLTRPISYYLLFLILVAILLVQFQSKYNWKKILLLTGAYMLPLVLLVGGWQIRNYRIANNFAVSAIEGINLLYYRGAGILALRDGISFEEAQNILRSEIADIPAYQIGDIDRQNKARAIELFRTYPMLFVKMEVLGLAKMMIVPGEGTFLKLFDLELETSPIGDLVRLTPPEFFSYWFIKKPVNLLLQVVVMLHLYGTYVLAIYAIFYHLIRKKLNISLIFLIATGLYFIAISAGPEAYARFRIPFTPTLTLFAGFGLWQIIHNIKHKIRPSTTMSTASIKS